MLIGSAAGPVLFCSPCSVVIARRRAGDGCCRLVISQCNGEMYPRGNQGQPPLLVQSDGTAPAARATGAQLGSRNPDNHANDGQRESSVEPRPISNLSSIFVCVCDSYILPLLILAVLCWSETQSERERD